MSKVNSQRLKVNTGLTFIELIIVVGIIVIIAATIIIVIQPGERLAESRDNQRETHLNAILHAVEQRIYQNRGWTTGPYCASIPSDELTIIGSDYYDLYSCLIPDYLSLPHVDPREGYYNSLESYNTGYEIWQDPVSKMISLRVAPEGWGETRFVYLGDPYAPKLILGKICNSDDLCMSGNCVDGVCCESPEIDLAVCEACNVPGSKGYVTFAPVGWSEPRGLCVISWACDNDCARRAENALCDGAGSCAVDDFDYAPSDGYVCYQNSWTAVSSVTVAASVFCEGPIYDCSLGACSGFERYQGCLAETEIGECTSTNQYSAGITAPDYDVFTTEQCDTSGEITMSGDSCKWCVDGVSVYKVKDGRDNKVYNTEEIGLQCWLAQGLNHGSRVNGANEQDNDTIVQKYCYADSDLNCDSNNNPSDPDGGLYQWAQAMDLVYTCNSNDCSGQIAETHQGICPDGWHIPDSGEWDVLTGAYSGTQLQPGGASGFEGNLAGHRAVNGNYAGRTDYAGFWSTEQYENNTAWYRSIYDQDEDVYELLFDKKGGFTVRCMLD